MDQSTSLYPGRFDLISKLRDFVISNSIKNENFRNLIVEDPIAAIKNFLFEKEYQLSIPEDFEVKVVEETDNKLFLVIPSSLEELESNASLAKDDPRYMILGKALKSLTFRNELIANPKMVLERELGVSLPGRLVIEAVEESPAKVWIVLPQDIQMVHEPELSPEMIYQLEMAGGYSGGGGGYGGTTPLPESSDPKVPHCKSCLLTPTDCDSETKRLPPNDCPSNFDTWSQPTSPR